MAIRKRGNIWWLDITVTHADGHRERTQESARTADRVLAQELHDQRKADLWRESRLSKPKDRTWADAVKLYKTEKYHLKSLGDTVAVNINWLGRHIKDTTKLSEIEGMLPDIRRARIEQVTHKGTPPKMATVNLPLSILSSILKLAAKRGYMTAAPHIEIPNPRNGRIRWITLEEANKLIDHIREQGKEAFANLVEFSFETGLRQSNAVSLVPQWINIGDKTVTVPKEDFKGKREFTLPLSDRAFQLVVRGLAMKNGYVFATERGKKFANPNEQLKEACKAVGITNFHWHDIRHTWATWHARAGTPLGVLQKLGGWRDYSMVLRYAVFAPDHVAAHANNIRRVSGGDVMVTTEAQAA